MSSKRGHGEGSIGKRKNGKWWGRVSLPDGRRKAFYADTQKEVLNKLNRAKSDLRAGKLLSTDRITVKKHSIEWLETIELNLARKTYLSYESLLRTHIWPSLGNRQLSQLQPKHIQSTYSALLTSGVTPATLGNAHRAFHASLQKAVHWRLIDHNPTEYVDLPKVRRPEKPVLSEKEVRNFLAAAADHPLEALFILACTTGARSGELLALRWKDVDFENAVIHIRKSLKRTSNGFEMGDTKTASSHRDIDLGARTVQALREHRSRQNEASLALGSAWDSSMGLVFTNAVGGALDQTNVLKRHFRPLLKEAGLDTSLRFHDLRHIFASIALSRGMDVVRVSAMLGHSSPATTLSVYSHALPGHGKSIAAVLDTAIAG